MKANEILEFLENKEKYEEQINEKFFEIFEELLDKDLIIKKYDNDIKELLENAEKRKIQDIYEILKKYDNGEKLDEYFKAIEEADLMRKFDEKAGTIFEKFDFDKLREDKQKELEEENLSWEEKEKIMKEFDEEIERIQKGYEYMNLADKNIDYIDRYMNKIVFNKNELLKFVKDLKETENFTPASGDNGIYYILKDFFENVLENEEGFDYLINEIFENADFDYEEKIKLLNEYDEYLLKEVKEELEQDNQIELS